MPVHARRRFLEVIGAGMVGVAFPIVSGCASANQTTGQSEARGTIAGGNVSGLPVGGVRVLDNDPVVIIRDDSGVYAMSTICTHMACDMRNSGSVGAGGLVCSCHGSQFDETGAVLNGPARRALTHYLVEIDATGEMTVQADNVVDASARTAIPSGVAP